jgi:RimJ/RimL family protein N-acetyltransferase
MVHHGIHAALARERINTFLAQADRRARQARRPDSGRKVWLRDGPAVLIRPVRPADAGLLADGFARLSQRSRRMRFPGPKEELSAAELRFLTDVDHHDHEALGALDHVSGGGVGIARYARDRDDPHTAEIALTVIDDWQGRGLGTELLARLSERACQKGIRRFTAAVAADNAAMAGLLRAFGADLVRRESGTLDYEIELACRVTRPLRASGSSRYRQRAYHDGPRVAGGNPDCPPGRGRMLSMLGFLFRKVLLRILMAIALPLALVFARYLARAVLRHAVIKPAAKALSQADSTVTDASRRASRKARQLTPVTSES